MQMHHPFDSHFIKDSTSAIAAYSDACVKRLTAFAGSVDENSVMAYTRSQTARPAEEKTAESNGERSEKYSVTYGGRRGEASAAKLCPKKTKTREHEEDEVEEEVKAR